MIVGIIIGGVILPIFFVIKLAIEQHDKDTREKNGLPPRKYHDIMDYDVTTVYTIEHKSRKSR